MTTNPITNTKAQMELIQKDNKKDQIKMLLVAMGLVPSGSSANWNPKDKNFALIVLQMLSILGMNNLQHGITDMGDLQNAQSQVQGALSNLGSFFSMLEGSVTKSANGLPSNFWSKSNTNTDNMTRAMKELYDLFHSNTNKSLPTASTLYIEIGGEKIYANGTAVKNGKTTTNDLLKNYISKVAAESGLGCLSSGIPSGDTTTHFSLAMVYVVDKLQVGLDKVNPKLVLSKIKKGGGADYLVKNYNPSNWNSIDAGLQGLYTNLNVSVNGGYSLWGILTATVQNSGNSWQYWKQGQCNDVENTLDQMSANYFIGTNANEGSLLETTYASLSYSQNLFQTQTTTDNSTLQQETQQITSYDQIGKEILSEIDKNLSLTVDNAGQG